MKSYGVLIAFLGFVVLSSNNSPASAAIVLTDEARALAADALKQWAIEKGSCWFYGNTGNHICDQIQKGHHGKMHMCALMNSLYPKIYCNPLTETDCTSQPPSQETIDIGVELAKDISRLGSGDLQFDQEVSKVALEKIIQLELGGAAPITFLRTALICSHDFAKELYDDVNKCDDNAELARQYANIVHMIKVDDLAGCDKHCGNISFNVC